MKRLLYITLAGFLLTTGLPQAFGQSAKKSGKLWSTRSLDMGISNRGFAVGGTWRHSWNRLLSSPAQLSLLFFRESDSVPYSYYDYNYGMLRYYDPPSKKIVFLNMRTGLQHRLWAESLAENMQPYLVLSGGPTVAFDPANDGGFISRWKQTELGYTAHLFVGAGVDVLYSENSKNMFTVSIGYEFMYFPMKVDGDWNYSGIMINFSFGERL